MKKTYKTWTNKEHTRLVTMHENKLPVKEIAKALGRTVSSVNNRLAKIKELVGPHTVVISKNEKPKQTLLQKIFSLIFSR